MRPKYIPIIAILLLIFFVGPASAVSNAYTQSGTWDFKTNLSTNNVYDSSKISSLSINATPSVQHVDPENISGLMARYKFDDGTGTNVLNSINSSNNGTVSGGYAWNTTGKYIGALTLNGNNTSTGLVQINDPVLNSTSFTLSIWSNANFTAYGSPFSDCNSTIKNIVIYFNDANTTRFYAGNGTTLSSSVSNGNWTANEWHLLTFTFNGTTGVMSNWVDLHKVSATTTITQIGNTSAGSTASAFGRYFPQYSGSQGFLNGSIDDALFYNRSLTDAEIQSLYYSKLINVTVKTNANSNSGTIPDNGGSANIPYSSGSILSLIATVPNSVVVDGTTIADYTRTAPPINYALSVVSSEEYTPVASFTNTPSHGTRPVTVSFTDTSSNIPTSWNWNFGDGGTSHSQNPTHQYTTAGTYTITLTTGNGQGSSTSTKTVSVLPAAGDNGVINNGKRVAIYIENTATKPMSHDTGFGSMLQEYNITYLTNATVAGNLSIVNYDLLVVGAANTNLGWGSCSNSTAKYINDYIASGGSVWFIDDPLNEYNTYMTNMSNATLGLPTNRFYCLGSLTQINVTGGATLTVNNADTATIGLPSSITSLATANKWTNVRNFGGISGQNAYGYNYTELVYYNGDATKCQLAKVWNDTTGSRVVYSNVADFISGGDTSYFNATTGSQLFDNMKTWVLKLDNNSMGVSVTYPRGDKQFVVCIDDVTMSSYQMTPELDRFYDMIKAQPNKIGITAFVIPANIQGILYPGSMASGYSYYIANETDVNTIHPHQANLSNPSPASVDWWNNSVPLLEMQPALGLYMYNYSAGINNDTRLRFVSYRSPQTKTNITNSLAVANLGFKLTSNYGPSTTMSSIADAHTNMRHLPKVKILNGVKTQCIELEAAAAYDTSYAESGTTEQWIENNEAAMARFFEFNMPGIYLVNGHWQWIMTNEPWTNAFITILWYADNQTVYAAYNNLSTLADYMIAKDNASIRVDTIGSTTTATVNAKYPIKDFTLKLQNINSGITVSLDGVTQTANHVIYEDGYYYVFVDIPTGTHTLTVVDQAVSGAKYIGKNGAVSVNISNGAFVKNNAASAKVAVTNVLSPYTNCTNTMSADNNTVTLGAHNMSRQLPATFIPTGGVVNVTVRDWNNTYKRWNESSAASDAITDHWIGGFLPDQYTVLKIDGVAVGEYTASDAGYIAFRYDGGYSEHEFVAQTNNSSDFDVIVAPKDGTTLDALKIVNVNSVNVFVDIDHNIVGSVVAIVTNGYSMASIIGIVLAVLAIIGFFKGDL